MTTDPQPAPYPTTFRIPEFPLGRAGDVFVHAGPRLEPRIVSVPTEVSAFTVDVQPGAELFTEFGILLDRLGVRGAAVEMIDGDFATLPYVHPDFGPDAAHPMLFSADFSARTPARLHAGSATLGFRVGDSDPAHLEPFAHVHASWTDPEGRLYGGHLRPGVIVGRAGLRLQFFAYDSAEQLSSTDAETGLPTFSPRPYESGSSVEPGNLESQTVGASASADATASDGHMHASIIVAGTTRRGIVARVRPGLHIDEAVVEVCRTAGFTTAEVRGGVGSTIGALLVNPSTSTGTPKSEERKVTEVAWPAVEYSVLRGHVDLNGEKPNVELYGEVIDIHAEMHSGTVLNQANPVAVTFELLVLDGVEG